MTNISKSFQPIRKFSNRFENVQLIRKCPTQILRQAKRVWEAAILNGDGRAWVYFIFSICQWLPTNGCLYRKLPSDRTSTACFLCLGNKTETMEHLLVCPALITELRNLQQTTQKILTECKFPFASFSIQSRRRKIIESWISAGSYLFQESSLKPKLVHMASDFFSANEHKQFIGTRHFLEQASLVMRAQTELKCERTDLPEELLATLSAELNLWVEGNTDALNHHTYFTQWFSQRREDSWFGSGGCPTSIPWAGSSTYLNLIDATDELFQKLFAQVLLHLDSLDPTRVVLVGRLNLLKKLPGDRRILELAIINDTIGIFLAINKSSMVVDPISWSSLFKKLTDWGEASQDKLIIPAPTDALFRERTPPSHLPRVCPVQRNADTFLFSFFEPPTQVSQPHIGIPSSSARLIHKINQFEQNLLVLGILPNQLRKLAKDHKMEQVEESLLLLGDALFWEGYEIWKKRMTLVKKYWKNIAPNEWKVDAKEKKSRKKRRMLPNCKNPFHYLTKYCDLSGQRPAPCSCSDVVRKDIPEKLPDIRSFLTKFPKRYWGTLDPPRNDFSIPQTVSKNIDNLSREDLVRREHDRGKKKKNKKKKRGMHA